MHHRLLELISDKEIREHRRVTIAEIARDADVSRQTIYTILKHGIRRIDADTIAKLCVYFDIEIGDLLYIEREEA